MENEVLKLIARAVMKDESQIELSKNLSEIGWDSLATLEFIADCDSRFGINVESDVLRSVVTVQNLVDVVLKAKR